MRLIRLIIMLLILITCLEGCAGVLVLGTTKETYGPNVNLVEHRQLIKSTSPRQVTKEDVLKKWGEPDEKSKDGESEVWTYRHEPEGMSWTGVVVGLIIPIPLVVPTGYYKTSMTFTGDLLTNSERVKKTGGGFFCVAISPDGMRPYCGAGGS